MEDEPKEMEKKQTRLEDNQENTLSQKLRECIVLMK